MSESHLAKVVHQWLLLLGVPLEKRYVDQRLVTHPDFPSALCITSLLDELGIENNVAQVDQTELTEIKVPFLAFIDNEKFVLITQVEEMGSFILDNRWNGIVVIAEKPQSIVESNELKKIKTSSRTARLKWIAASCVLLLLISLSCFNLSQINIILLMVVLLGLAVCSSIVLKETGIDTVLSKQLCGVEEETGCNAVLNSQASTLPLGIKLSDLGIAFFSGIVLLLLIKSFSETNFQMVSEGFVKILFLISLPFTFASIYYQWRIIRQWCAFCVLVIVILWICSSIEIWQGQYIELSSITDTLTVFGIFALPGIAWILVRQLLNQNQELKNSNILLQRIYRSPELLKAHLLRQNKIEVASWPFDFQIGRAEAQCQIIVVSSHFCGPCSETYEVLRTLIKRHKTDLGITIRILVNKTERGDAKEQIQRHMLQYALSVENFFNQPDRIDQMLSDWYELKNPEKFRERYPLKEKIAVEDILRTQNEWFRSSHITYTPTVIVNGYKLESPYSPTDLLELSSSLIEIAETVLEEETY